jgi:hypothetical protein
MGQVTSMAAQKLSISVERGVKHRTPWKKYERWAISTIQRIMKRVKLTQARQRMVLRG